MNICVLYAPKDREFAFDISSALKESGHIIFSYMGGKVPLRHYNTFEEQIIKSDAVIAIVSNFRSFNDHYLNERISLFSFFPKRLVIPVVLGTNTKLPLDLLPYKCVTIPYEKRPDDSYESLNKRKLDETKKEQAFLTVKLILAEHAEIIKQNEEKQKKSEEKVRVELSKYIVGALDNLREGERKNKKLSLRLYWFSIIPLVATFIVIEFFLLTMDWQTENIGYMIAYSLSILLIVVILISLSKLLFTLAKSFMVESIRCSDRIHAINFGKFFLDAYGTEASREEVLKAFSAWNIDNGNTSFRNQSGEDYDPKIPELINALKDLIKK